MEFTSNVEELSPIKRQITVTIEAAQVAKEIEDELVKLTRTATMKGFRPGKAPRQLVEKLHGDRVRFEVADRLVSQSLNDVAKGKDLDIVGTPSIELKDFKPGSNLEYKAVCEIFPRPEVKDYDKFEVRVSTVTVKDSDVDQVLERFRDAHATMRKLEFRNQAKEGDIVDAVVQVKVAGEAAEGRGEPQSFALGSGRLPEDVEKGMAGQEIGQTREFQSRIPDNYRDAKLRGKEATYVVSLTSLSEKVLPELNDEFAKTVGGEVAQTLLELRGKVRESLETEKKKRTENEAQSKVLDELVQRNPFEVPQALIDDEIRGLVSRSGLIDPQKINVNDLPVESFREGLGEIAAKRVRSAILVDRIAEKDNLRANQEQVDKRIKEIADENKVSEQEVRKFLHENNRMFGLMLDVTRDNVIGMLMSRAQVETYEEEEKPAEAESK